MWLKLSVNSIKRYFEGIFKCITSHFRVNRITHKQTEKNNIKHIWGANSIKMFFIKYPSVKQREVPNYYICFWQINWATRSRRSTRERIKQNSRWIKKIIWTIENILKNFGTELFSLFTIKNQTEDRFIVNSRINTCMYSACMYMMRPWSITESLLLLKNQHKVNVYFWIRMHMQLP